MQKLGVFYTILTLLTITACDNKTEHYYKSHPNEAKEKAKQCKESNTLNHDCINAFKIGIKPTNEQSKYSPNIQTKFNNKASSNQNQSLKKESQSFKKDINQSLENEENAITPPIVEIFSEIYPSKIKDNNHNFNNNTHTIQEKLP
ncbi:EexN family lipoprotein [Campylobacter sp. VicNov18]|uniref:EexN family lipoprotein n=1 Tax=Campylobacter bilis TaxID=2691918 RepID=UPI00130EB0BC|nr:EexN family lipoprotein [Campylobacter bilis]MPV63398.1 EexN family lipoprotein [Campylobacter hepaticus]MBM0636897.1 EexN family lipoprotein [Campylobacter bilis]MCC8277606.1 EexN family lipoprotein [Campylobacter bilis]MCC8299215.1 EexN family lipoprotein [Campylobacter bilis]MCC8300515.1 EexN family lipoprotein [Campylobacter bilis]